MVNKNNYDKYHNYLKQNLSAKRYSHSVCVADESVRLAGKYGANQEKAYLAGLLHDICKEMPENKQQEFVIKSSLNVGEIEKETSILWHAISGAQFVLEHFHIDDIEILSPIRYHTVAKDNMTKLESIVYLADFISADRAFKGLVKIRNACNNSLQEGMREALVFSIKDLIAKNKKIPVSTFMAYNQYV